MSGVGQGPGHVAVIGAGLAAVSLCAALRADGFTGRLTVIGDERCHPYDRPPLSKQFLAGERDAAEIALQSPEWYLQEGIDLRLGVPAAAFDASTRRVELADGTALTADVLVLATGGRARRLSVPGGQRATVLRTRADAEALRDRLAPGVRVLIAGAGLIGAEVAATTATTHHGCQVTLVDPNPLPMEHVIGPHAARALHAQHASHGVTVIQGSVRAVEPGHVILSTGRTVPADVVVAGIGIVPDVELARNAGLDVDNGVLVDTEMRTSAPGVYAIGDIARVTGSPQTSGQSSGQSSGHRSEHWDNARRTAEAAARSILGLPAEPRRAPWFWTDRYGTHLEMTGLYDPDAQAVPRGDIEAGNGTVFYVRDARCVGAVSLDRPLDIRAAQRMVDRDIPVEVVRLADEATDLRRLLIHQVHDLR